MSEPRVFGARRSQKRKKKPAQRLPAGISPNTIDAELKTILASPTCQSSGLLSDFLTFIVERARDGRTDIIDEPTIAKVVLKKADYDRTLHSAVRVEARRLRDKLREYYDECGRDDPVVITLPKNNRYIPVFKLRPNRRRRVWPHRRRRV